MRYGVCFGLGATDNIRIAAESGFDYIECGFYPLARDEDAPRKVWTDAIKSAGIKLEAANCFMPNDLRVTGPGELNYAGMKEYIDKGMYCGSELGLKKIVFGSSGARNIPEGFSYEEGFRQMVYFLGEIVAPIAEKYDITVVTEPLRPGESNMINTVKEGVMLAAVTGSKHISGLADVFHMVKAGDTYDDIRFLKGSIKHAHISNPNGKLGKNRIFPLDVNEFDYKGFIDALRFAECETCSIEADAFDFAAEAPVSLALLRGI